MTLHKPTNRREFLRNGASLGAGLGFGVPYIILGNALGAPGIDPASERIRMGAVGLGPQGNSNLGGFMKHIVTVCDVDRDRLAAAKARVEKANGGHCDAFSDFRKLLEDKNIDAVVVSTPDHWHVLVAAAACQAGKDVYCEKPLSYDVAEGKALVKAVRTHARILQTGSQQRSDRRFRQACELVRSGRLGKIHTVRVGIPGVNWKGPAVPDTPPPPPLDYDFWLGPAPERPYNPKHVHYNFRFYWDYAGGQMTNWGAHHIDIAQWGLGTDHTGPVAVEAQARFQRDHWYDVPEWFQATYQYADGVKMIVGQGIRAGTTFEGDRGSIYVTRGHIESNPPDILLEPLTEKDVHLYVSNNHHQNFLDCVKSRKLPICDVEIGHRSATICHLGNIAVRTGHKFRWDPAREEIVGDPDAAALLTRANRPPWVV